jgi:hypothetical protein
MKHKDLCYEILRDAALVIDETPELAFRPGITTIGLTMNMSGVVDVAAPLPPKHLALHMLRLAKAVIERFNDDAAPEMRPFNRAVMAEP